MKLIIGLGNPGKNYKDTRHNVGSNVIFALCEKFEVALKKDWFISAQSAKIVLGKEHVVLAVPQTYMNLSGIAVKALVKKHKIDLSDILIVCDDLDLDTGLIKIKTTGSASGHNGVKSIIEHLKSQEFSRLRIGIGRPKHVNADISDYVLSKFEKKEKQLIDETIKRAGECVESWIVDGQAKCMNVFNR